MGKKHRFDYFDSFEALTKLAVQESDLLIESIERFTEASALKEPMGRAHEIEHEGDEINHAIFKTVATEFITPIDREDIIELAQALDDVIDCVEECMRRFYMYDVHAMHDDAIAFAKLIKASCEALDEAMCDFRNFKKSKRFKSLIVKVNDCEEQGDELYMQCIRRLHTDDRERAMYVHVWSNIFDRMEKCCDASEHVADVMSTILLKNL